MPRNTSGLRSFKPGQTGNPTGRNGALPPEIRRERKSNQSELIQLITFLFKKNDAEIEDLIMTQKPTQLQAAVVAMIGKAKEGDVPAFKYLMETMVGRIPETDYDGFTEEDLAILNRVKEVFYERDKIEDSTSGGLGSGH